MSKMNEKRKRNSSSITMMHPHAAGIDIGSEVHYVCVPEDRDDDNLQKFGCFTQDLHRLVAWLKRCQIDTVAMESTGVYWIPLYQLLEEADIKVFLVNARHVKNVPEKKTDVVDCQWLQQLHSYGLLQAYFKNPISFAENLNFSRIFWTRS